VLLLGHRVGYYDLYFFCGALVMEVIVWGG
jgi:hypothetical protein